MIYFTSDLHLGHVRALEIMPNRPWPDVEAMNQGLIDNYNSVVKPEDTCIFLGDVIMGSKVINVPKYLPMLNGTKHLITGNHDYLPSEIKKEGKLEWYENLYLLNGMKTVYHGCVSLYLFTNKTTDFQIKLCHFPPADVEDNREIEYEQRYTHLRPAIAADQWLLHGHSHSREHISSVNSIHIGVDAVAWDYKPVSMDTILGIINK